MRFGRSGAPRAHAVPARTPIWIAGGLLMLVVFGGWRFWASRSARPKPDAIWERAQEDLRAGRYELVERAVDRLQHLRAPTPMDWFLRAQLALVRNQPDEAVASLARVPDGHNSATRARLLSGQIERQEDRLRLAEEAFRAALRLDPSLVQAHRELIYIYGMQLRQREINDEFLSLRKLTRLSYEEVYRWTSLLNNSWEPGDVIGDLIRFVAADPDDRWSRLALAENLRKMGLHDTAERTLAILARQDNEANVIRAQIAFDRQQTEKANALLELGKNDDPAIARLRGRQALARRDPRSAVRHFRIAFAADPNDHETLFGLQGALELLCDEKGAASIRETARNVARLNTMLQRASAGEAGRNLNLLRHLGTVCADLRRNDEARAWLELAITRNPLDSESQQALFRLRAAGPESPRTQAHQGGAKK